MFVRLCVTYLHGVQGHEHCEAAQMFTCTHSMWGSGVQMIATICWPGASLIPVRTDVLHLIGLCDVLMHKDNMLQADCNQ